MPNYVTLESKMPPRHHLGMDSSYMELLRPHIFKFTYYAGILEIQSCLSNSHPGVRIASRHSTTKNINNQWNLLYKDPEEDTLHVRHFS